MTQDEIIDMAVQAHFDSKTWVDIFADNPTVGDVRNYLIAFAKLVAAKEREACAKLCDELSDKHTWVGLTNEELTDLFYNTNLGQQSAVSQAVALLKERNS